MVINIPLRQHGCRQLLVIFFKKKSVLELCLSSLLCILIPHFCSILLKYYSYFLRLWPAKSSFPEAVASRLTVKGSQIPVTNLSFVYNIHKYWLIRRWLFTLTLYVSEELFYSGLYLLCFLTQCFLRLCSSCNMLMPCCRIHIWWSKQKPFDKL